MSKNFIPKDPAKTKLLGAFRRFLKADEIKDDMGRFRITKVEQQLAFDQKANEESAKWVMFVEVEISNGKWYKAERPILINNGLANGDNRKHKLGMVEYLAKQGANTMADCVGLVVTLKKVVFKTNEAHDVFRIVDTPADAQHNRKVLRGGKAEPVAVIPQDNPQAEQDSLIPDSEKLSQEERTKQLGYD